MRFKGIRFYRAPAVVVLPVDPQDPDANYAKFGRICKPDTPGAVKTSWSRGGEALYAKPIPLSGHSRTDMAYGADGRVYLIHDGRCYSAPSKRRRREQGEATAASAETVGPLEDTPSDFRPPRRPRLSSLAERLARAF